MSGGADPALVRRLARLARLELTDDEVARFARDLAGIVAHVDHLAEVDTDGVPPTTIVTRAPVGPRDDLPAPGLDRDAALAGSADARDGAFVVPAFLDGAS